MATTSIWAVKGWLGKVVFYIENPEKTENPQFYRQKDMTDVQTQNLSDVIDYAARPDKTTEALDSESVPRTAPAGQRHQLPARYGTG